MYDVSPTDEEFDRALRIVKELCGTTVKGQLLSDEELREWTQKVLDTCNSIGGDYGPRCVTDVAKRVLLPSRKEG